MMLYNFAILLIQILCFIIISYILSKDTFAEGDTRLGDVCKRPGNLSQKLTVRKGKHLQSVRLG